MSSVAQTVERARKALNEFEHLDQAAVDRIVAKAGASAVRRHTELARLAVAETGRGVVEDKSVKNVFACEHVTHHMRGLRTAGVVRRDTIDGIVEIAAPVGVVCAVTPVTNPTSTVLFKALAALKTRNPIIFSFHHAARRCGMAAASAVRDAAVAAGAPANCVQWLDEPSREATAALMRHEDVALILATGGRSLVQAAYSSGTPALGVGAGSTPAYVERTADLRRAAHDIVMSTNFDHGMVCSAEQTVVVDREVEAAAMEELRRLGAYVASPEEVERLERSLFTADGDGSSGFDPDGAGQPAARLAERAGFRVPDGTPAILAPVAPGDFDRPITLAKPCPVLALTSADGREEGISHVERLLQRSGLGHTAAVHTEDEAFAEEFGNRVRAVRIVWNSPSTQGGIGGIYNAFLPSLTLGGGSYGGTSVSGNVQAADLLNIKRVGRRTSNMQWFKVPPKIYFERHSLRYLADMPGVRRAALVTGPGARRRGHVQRVREALQRREKPVDLKIIDDVDPDPTLDTVRRGAARLAEFAPDTIIALGGGSAMDAAKAMWLLFEAPETEFTDMRARYLDIRKRAFAFPEVGSRARLVCVPTTAGSGAEVTPFTVITDPETGLKHPVADYALTPSVAICDPELTTDLPPTVTADSGFDALTHAIEAYVSVYANDFTDGLCLKAIQLVFENLEQAVLQGADAPKARERMHNAATIAGMAFGNAFLGIVHAMSHTLGSTFGTSHGRTNALLLPHVIRYNGTVTSKLTGWPKYEVHTAPERFQEIARHLGRPAAAPAQGVSELACAVEDLRDRVGIESSFRAAGVDEDRFKESLPQQAMNAFNDQCAPANPRMPMLADMERLMLMAYYGHGEGSETDRPPRGSLDQDAVPVA
ncbi:bifunctional acetaldehyde-CoA/alcohol dehydrogenase [Nocardiopsis halophila]|uniref:bifunctional acetaldehyde-CoA/alcohol dehydrogenase n=1 Tax=Nocardiopsis halophila TaxID=141692 RepID=UPI000345BB37|nr:bifunctional acetaldehyde-CoA/alcohol dehydrogenase [Nocardiopsis halophila]